MNEARFVRLNRPDWTRLEGLMTRLDGTGAGLSGSELFTLVSLYRKSTGDLSRARMYKLRSETIDYLNGLVGRAHLRIYAPPPYPFHKVLDFFRRGFPAAVRRRRRAVLTSAALLLVPALVTYLAVRASPPLGTAFAPPGYVEKIEQAFGSTFGKEERPGGLGAMATSFYIINNIQVSFLAFSLGFFLGLGSVYIITLNGAILGGVGALVREHGVAYNFWSFVASHGGIELLAIVLAGAAGLHIGSALLNPGMATRKAALVAAGREAGLLMFGVMAFLVLAAGIEAWISPSTLPNPLKLTLGALNLAGAIGYLLWAGRSPGGAKPASEAGG